MTTIAAVNVGTRGTVFIDDDGYNIRFYLSQGDAATFIGSPGKDWYGTINNAGVGGKWTWAKGGGTRLIAGPYGIGTSQTVGFGIGATGTQGFGNGGSVTAWVARATTPGQPGTPSASEITPTSMRLSWAIPGNGGAGIDQMLLRRSGDPNFSSYQDYPFGGGVSSAVIGGLVPATPNYWRVYAHNALGYGPSSGILSQSTLPASAPGISVLPAISGGGSTVTVSPPGGASGVTGYRIERRAFGTTAPVVVTDSASGSIAQPGLTPGSSYEYRASVFFGSYQSPWSAWVAAIQPNPNTDPGGYFDGNTPSTPALVYSWTAAAGNSTSVATGRVPTGWRTFAQSAAQSGGTGAVFQSVGGFAGSWAARAIFQTDATGSGFMFGTATTPTSQMAAVEAGEVYYGSVHAKSSRATDWRPVLLWFNAAGAAIGTGTFGATVTVAGADAPYQRLTVSGMSPAGAAFAAVVVQHIASNEPSLRGGDWIQLDAAMISLQDLYPYFDGDTLDAGLFGYSWLGPQNASVSMRTTLAVSLEVDPLLDPDCPPIPAAPLPPDIDDSCVDEVGTWRRYWIVIPEEEVYEWRSVVPELTITSGGAAARQVRVRFYPNPDGLPPELARGLAFESEQIVTYMPPNTVMTLDGVSESVWASVAGGEERNADHLLRGTGGLPPTWPVLSCGASYLISFDVPLDAPDGNIVVGASLTPRMM